ncbi:MAG: BREX-3 system P-loop-containing protein BrxF [Negativicutes bacterium]|nr:BREX-3 system P-loop-containing protein BrxF [Negativicutes bacterium]
MENSNESGNIVSRVYDAFRQIDNNSSGSGDRERLIIVPGLDSRSREMFRRELVSMRRWEYIDCRKIITREILNLQPHERPVEAPAIVSHYLGRLYAEVIVVDHLEVLFAPLLHLSPVEFLKQLATENNIVAIWPGEYRDGRIFFRNNNGEYSFPDDGLFVLQ